MCGIAALLSSHTTVQISDLKKMTDIIQHRGPDGDGHFAENGVLLGHRRLSILDLSDAGHQPMSYRDRFVITYNGEIYNYIEIRDELLRENYDFRSDCDTEVILAAFDKWGPEALQRFNGMFSFVLYDRRDRTIFAARDRFGVKPLYYWVSKGEFIAFASEIKQFTTLPRWRATLNREIASEFLISGLHDHNDETFFKDVFQVEPGHCVQLQLDQLSAHLSSPRLPTRAWYTLRSSPFKGSLLEAADRFRTLFQDSIRLRMRSDVDVGSCLSGGLDSSAIVCQLSEIRDRSSVSEQKTFSAYSEHPQFDESHHIKTVVAQTHTRHHSTVPHLDTLVNELDRIVWHQDEPFGSTSIFAQWEVFKLARSENCTVMLDGQGADEQLAGYSTFIRIRLTELFREGRWKRFFKEARSYRASGRLSVIKIVKIMAAALLPEKGFRWLKRLAWRIKLPSYWLAVPLRSVAMNEYERREVSFKDVNQVTRAQMTGLNLQMLLRYEDRDSMAHSIEARVPFLDYRLAEFIDSLPSDYKISDGVSKRVQREAMTGILPESIRQRMDKLGFATAEEIWMTKSKPDYFRGLLAEAVENSHGLIKTSALERFDLMVSGEVAFDFSIWRCISVSLWIKMFKVAAA